MRICRLVLLLGIRRSRWRCCKCPRAQLLCLGGPRLDTASMDGRLFRWLRCRFGGSSIGSISSSGSGLLLNREGCRPRSSLGGASFRRGRQLLCRVLRGSSSRRRWLSYRIHVRLSAWALVQALKMAWGESGKLTDSHQDGTQHILPSIIH